MASLSRMVALEALECVAVRARWYETRGKPVPARTMQALRQIAAELGIDPRAVGQI